MNFDSEELAEFLVKAKTQTYAGDGHKVEPQRPGFKEFEFSDGDWNYRDSYAGFYSAPGQEVVRFQGEPVWTMVYSGGMRPKYQGQEDFSRQTFAFLKKALLGVGKSQPFRGPGKFHFGGFEYLNIVEGDVTDFHGVEKIFHDGDEVFRQNYIGGLIVPKSAVNI